MFYRWGEQDSYQALLNHPSPVQILLQMSNSTIVYGHTGNAFDGDDGCVYLDAPLTYHNKV